MGDDTAGRKTLVAACLTIAALIALLIVATFPSAFLDGTAPFWIRAKLDIAEHIVGGRYFVHDAWRWPLLFVPKLGLPLGTNIGLTDSIPLAALAAKLLRPVFGANWDYIPMWSLACFLLQGPACALALYALRIRDFWMLVLGGLIGFFCPVLLYRFGHIALCSHFILLTALTLHVRHVQQWRGSAGLLLYLPLLALALLVHVYLFVMVLALAFASLLHGLWIERVSLLGAFAHLAAIVIVVAPIMWACGYFSLGPIPPRAYGEFALDLAAPFTPGPSGLLAAGALPGGRNPEDFAYFGAGVLLLIVVAFVSCRRRIAGLFATFFPTLVMAVALIAYSLTYSVRLGTYLILGIPTEPLRAAVIEAMRGGSFLKTLLPALTIADYVRIVGYVLLIAALAILMLGYAWRRGHRRFVGFLLIMLGVAATATLLSPVGVAVTLSNFQSSARFVWVVLYLGMLLAIAGVSQAFQRRTAIALLAAALCLQVADTAPLWGRIRAAAVAQPSVIADAPAIAAAIERAQEVRLVPTFLCANAEFDDDAVRRSALITDIVDVQVLASQWTRPINSVVHARLTAIYREELNASCAAERNEALLGVARPNLVTFVFAASNASAQLRRELAGRPECRVLTAGMLCIGAAR